MRVISGMARGRRLKELPGMDTRPTTDKVKGALFNIIQFDIEGRRVLDLFGGTGQLGIEALSRGAAECTFVELNRQAAAIICEETSLESHTATVGLALDKPVIVAASGATQRLADGVMVSVDCARGVVQTLPQ